MKENTGTGAFPGGANDSMECFEFMQRRGSICRIEWVTFPPGEPYGSRNEGDVLEPTRLK